MFFSPRRTKRTYIKEEKYPFSHSRTGGITMAIDYATAEPSTKEIVHEQLYCALTGVPVSTEEAYWAPPLVTFRQLIAAITQGLAHSPGTLGTILFAEQPNVPYAPAAREQLAARRGAEQIKLLVGLLLVVALIAAPILLLAMR
jgi:hypothetical protein